MVIIKHNTPWDKPWYDRRSKELNSLLNNPHNTNEIKALENIVDGIPIVDDYSVNNSHGFLDYARHIASNIFSHVPTPVKMGFATGLLALVAACSSGSVPTATPTNTPAPPSRATPAPTITITFPSPEELIMTPQASEATDLSTYKIIFPFKEPSSSLEEYVLNNTNVLTYMKFVRAKTDFTWAVSLANLVNQSINPLNWIDFFGKNKELSDLIPYIPREDIPIYQQSQPNYQGTKVEAKPVYFQQTATGELIPLENPDMDEQSFEEFKAQFSTKIQTYPLEWTMHKGSNNSGYVNVDVSLPLEEEWEVKIGHTLSPAAILGDRIYIGDEDDYLYVLNAQNGDIEQRIKMNYGPRRFAPAVTEDILILPLYGEHQYFEYQAVDSRGRTIWRTRTEKLSAPIIDGDTLYIIQDRVRLKAINIQDGRTYWSFSDFSDFGIPYENPLIADDEVYIISRNSFEVEGNRTWGVGVYALSKNGNLRWSANATSFLDEEDKVGTVKNTILAGNFLIWSNPITRKDSGKEYCVEAFDVTKKEVVFDQCVGEDRITSIVSDGMYVYASHGQNISRFSLDNGTFRELPPIQLEDEINEMVLTNNVLFAGTNRGVLAINRENNDISSIVQLDRKTKFLAYSGGALYVIATFGHVYKFSPSQ